MLQRPTLARTFLIVAMLAGACGLPLLANDAINQAPTRHGTEPRQEQASPPIRVRLEGSVTDLYDSVKKLPGATLEFVKGPNTGRSTVSDASGFYSFSDLEPSVGGQALRISHPSYKTGNFEPSVWRHRPVNTLNPRLAPLVSPPPKPLPPQPSTVNDSFRGSISSSQTACDMPDRDYPCEKFRLSTASGKTSLSAELTWTATTDIDLDLILYDNGVPTARSVSSGTKKDVLNARISGYGPFEIRTIVASGRGTASFALAVKRTK